VRAPTPRRRVGRRVATLVATLLVVPAVCLAPLAASATDAPASATGADGQRLTVSQSTDLAPAGQKITVTGSGYPTYKGVYVAVCKVPADGGLPTPCGGGADTSGASQTSAWVSSNPPSYGKGLAQPYGKGGTFEVTIWAAPTLPDGTDCREVGCAVLTRADHTRTSDRSQDVLIPVTFGSASSGTSVLTYVAAGVLVALLAGVLVALVVVLRNRRTLAAGADDGTGTATTTDRSESEHQA